MIEIRQASNGEVLHRVEANTLAGADLSGLSLYGADLQGAALSGAKLARTSLISANLERAQLDGANLDAATLYGANLHGATLRRASLRGADLRGANFEGANLSRASVHGARYDDQTRWPDEFDADGRGALRSGRTAGAKAPASDPRGTILVVEDDANSREVLIVRLRAAGYRVSIAENGREALEYLRTHRPPVLIMLDMMMPQMDGWTFRIEQLKDPALAAIPVVVCSAAYDPEPTATFVGAAGYLAKPYDFSLVLDVVRRCAR